MAVFLNGTNKQFANALYDISSWH